MGNANQRQTMIQNMIGIIGSGSWATAIVKILLERSSRKVNWWVRSEETREKIARDGRNPRHLPEAVLDAGRIQVSTDLRGVIADSTHLLLAIPSAYMHQVLDPLPETAFAGKKIISAIKGSVPDCVTSVSIYMQQRFGVSHDDICVVSGPSHAEEVCREMPTFLTVASANIALADEVATMLRCRYLHTRTTADIDGVERCGLAKNIYAIAAGICQGLDYGDNLNAVLTAAAMREIHNLLDHNLPFPDRNIYDSYYMGDLVVTCWSRHSRNRALGEAVAKGEKPAEVFARTGSVAEGYYSVKNLHQLATAQGMLDKVPIAETVYRILYEDAEPRAAMEYLIDNVF